MPFQCLENCGKCCWVVPIPIETWEVHVAERQVGIRSYISGIPDNVIPLTDDMHCAYLNRDTGKCMIYDARPQVCRDYGSADQPCPYVRPDGTPRSPRGVAIMEKKHFCLDRESSISYRRRSIEPINGFEVDVVQHLSFKMAVSDR